MFSFVTRLTGHEKPSYLLYPFSIPTTSNHLYDGNIVEMTFPEGLGKVTACFRIERALVQQ